MQQSKPVLFLDDVRSIQDIIGKINANGVYYFTNVVILNQYKATAILGDIYSNLHDIPVSITLVPCYDEFVKYIDAVTPIFISFDHDLEFEHYAGGEALKNSKSGADCARYCTNKWSLQDNSPKIDWYVHSANPVGILNIKSIMCTYNRICHTP